MPTTADLRELLHDRADTASTAQPPIEAAIRGARRVRTQRQLGVVAGAVAVVAALLIPTAVGWPTAVDAPPAVQPTARDGRVTSSSGIVWAPVLPGLDLPAGAPMTIPYAFDTVVVDGGAKHELGGVVRRLLDVPEGLVALVDIGPTTPDADGPYLPTRIVLIGPDGPTSEPKELDRGYISSVSASETAEGLTRLAWTWTDAGPDSPPTEVRARDLGLGTDMMTLVLPDPSFVWGFDGRDPILEFDHGEDPSFTRWDTDSGTLVRMPEHFDAVIAATSDLSVRVRYDSETECTSVVLADQPDAALWDRCDLIVQTLSPDGKFALGSRFDDGRINQTADQLAVVDLTTGADVAAFDLPPSGLDFGVPRVPAYHWFVESWESDGSALVFVLYEGLPGEDPDSNFAPQLRTLVRCAVTTGMCEQVPDSVEVVSSRS